MASKINIMLSKRNIFIIAVILIAAISRLLPHPPNFSPIGALALFGGAMLSNRWMGFLVPATAMLLSDVFIGFHDMMSSVYLSFGLTVLVGFWMGGQIKAGKVIAASIASSVLFFVITNFHMWVIGNAFYSRDLQGLITCFVAAVPFFANSFASDLFYSAILFGSFYIAEKNVPELKLQRISKN